MLNTEYTGGKIIKRAVYGFGDTAFFITHSLFKYMFL